MATEIERLADLPETYEQEDAINAALEAMPLEEFYIKATAAAERDSTWGVEDHVVMELLAWYKKWFKWVNEYPCTTCGGKTELRGSAKALEEEVKFGAGHAEVYWCAACQQESRFPRYNDPVKLLATREGRCGEWANAMTLLLRALGLDTRYIWNSEDHVWNEVYSHHQQRWVHVDSCEQAYDKPNIYTDGWGKKMAYVLGFSIYGATDVTKRYVRRPEMQLERTRFNEDALETLLISKTADLRDTMEPEEQVAWYERDNYERSELDSYVSMHQPSEPVEDLLPRQSGAPEWVEQRGEGGK